MNALAGYTGFVGSNLYAEGCFGRAYNSKNIEDAYGLKPDLLVYAGLRAEKYLADRDPDKDMQHIRQAEKNISRIAPKKLVLISTIDVFRHPVGVDENVQVDDTGMRAYGKNRFCMECWAARHYPDALIVRLPGLFGKNIKKNFIYDCMNRIPSMLAAGKMEELASRDNGLQEWYELQDNGFYKCRELREGEKKILRGKLEKIGFTALNFTDSRSTYQFYPLERLWDDIQAALGHGIRLLHLATEPVSAGELYEYLTGQEFCNELQAGPVEYDFRTIHDRLYGGSGGYILDKETVKGQIKLFYEKYAGK